MAGTPDLIGRYQIRSRLGEGGMGIVYLAHDPAMDSDVAIKLLKQGFDEDMRKRFAREAQLARRVGGHPNIVTIFDIGEHEGHPFIAMEYVPGETLERAITRGTLSWAARKLQVVEDLCAGLAHAHKAGLVHRDIKPANVMLTPDGVVKILDFGIARLAESDVTHDGLVVGALNYMSPEQISGMPLDYRSDVFAVGALFYELLSGRRAFPGTLREGLPYRIVHGTPTPLHDLVGEVDPEVERIIERALEKEPGQRYQDLGAMRHEITRVRQRLEAARVDGAMATAQRELKAGDYEAAMAAAEEALALNPDDARAVALRRQARMAVDQRRVRALLDEARGALRRGELDDASEIVGRAQGLATTLDPSASVHHDLSEMRSAIQRGREQLARAAAAMQQARTAFAAGDMDAALRFANGAIAADAHLTEARDLRERATAAIDEQRQREARERQAREAVAEARRAFDGGHRADAIAWLERVSPAHTIITAALRTLREEDETLTRREQEERARREQEERARREQEAWTRRAGEVVADARRIFDDGQRAEAIGRLEQFSPAHPVVTTTLEGLRHEHERLTRREQADRARREAEARARREQEALTRHAGEAVAEARRIFDSGQRTDAIARLEQFTPAHELVATALQGLRNEHEALERLEQDERARRERDERTRREQELARQEAARAAEAAAAAEAANAVVEAATRPDADTAPDEPPLDEPLGPTVATSILAQEADATQRFEPTVDARAIAPPDASAPASPHDERASAAPGAAGPPSRSPAAAASPSPSPSVRPSPSPTAMPAPAPAPTPAAKAATVGQRVAQRPSRGRAMAAVGVALLLVGGIVAWMLTRPGTTPGQTDAPAMSPRPQSSAGNAQRGVTPPTANPDVTPQAGDTPRAGDVPPATTGTGSQSGTTTPPSATATTGTPPASSPAEAHAQEIARQRQDASAQYTGGRREEALKTANAGLARNAADAGLRALVQGWYRDALRGVANARVQANRRSASSAAPTEYQQAMQAETRAHQLTQSGRVSDAVRTLWQAEALFVKASRQAELAASGASPAAKPGDLSTTAKADAPSTTGAGGATRSGSGAAGTGAAGSGATGSAGTAAGTTGSGATTGSGSADAPRTKPDAPTDPNARTPATGTTTGGAAATATTATAATAEADVRRALREYQTAWERLDADAVRRVRPSFTGDLAGVFRDYRLQFDEVKVSVSGTRATVTSQVEHTFKPKVGIGGRRTVRTTFRFEQRDGRWIIADQQGR